MLQIDLHSVRQVQQLCYEFISFVLNNQKLAHYSVPHFYHTTQFTIYYCLYFLPKTVNTKPLRNYATFMSPYYPVIYA